MPCGFSGHWPGSCAGLGMDPLRVLWKGPSKIISPQRVAPWRQKGAVGEMCWSDGEKRSLYNLGDSWCDQCTAAPRRTLPGLSSAAQQPFTFFSSWALLNHPEPEPSCSPSQPAAPTDCSQISYKIPTYIWAPVLGPELGPLLSRKKQQQRFKSEPPGKGRIK